MPHEIFQSIGNSENNVEDILKILVRERLPSDEQFEKLRVGKHGAKGNFKYTERYKKWSRYIISTNNNDIFTLYIWTIMESRYQE